MVHMGYNERERISLHAPSKETDWQEDREAQVPGN